MDKVKAFFSNAWKAIKSTPMVFVYGLVVGYLIKLVF